MDIMTDGNLCHFFFILFVMRICVVCMHVCVFPYMGVCTWLHMRVYGGHVDMECLPRCSPICLLRQFPCWAQMSPICFSNIACPGFSCLCLPVGLQGSQHASWVSSIFKDFGIKSSGLQGFFIYWAPLQPLTTDCKVMVASSSFKVCCFMLLPFPAV